MNEATRRQIEAARPDRSTWLSANAGSGKTSVLTDRVARLLLYGVSPQNILCLTYTKAAASEMQNRLFKRLGEWSMMPDDALRARLAAAGAADGADGATLAQARRLFARAIETPGGLRIQTIHAFCAGVLRRFPLESGISPQFAEMDDSTSRRLREECVETVAETRPALLSQLALHHSGAEIDALTANIARERDRFTPPRVAAGLRAAFGLPEGQSPDDLVAGVFLGGEAELLDRVAEVMRTHGTRTDIRDAGRLAAVPRPLGLASLENLEAVLLFGSSAAAAFGAKVDRFPTKAARDALPDDIDALNALMIRVEEARDARLAHRALERTRVLHDFAAAFLPLHAERKELRGWLDFDDLILKARDLLTRRDVAAWVLERLDGGIDHILVDEAQDTSPAQWQVIEALAQEITAGEGRKPAGERSIFVVGDKKQSIYSFQGADPEGFDRMHAAFAAQLGPGRLVRQDLLHSFRSSRVVLDAVDHVLAGQPGRDPDLRHIAFNRDYPGRVDLWPLVESAEEPEAPGFEDPVDLLSPQSATVRLADAIAAEVADAIADGVAIPDPRTGGRRAVHAGDFMILLRSRGPLFHEIIRACKTRGLEIAGADRMRLLDSLAVKDILAVLRFLSLADDDLSLAQALRSPLLGWSEAELFDLAARRGERGLWQALRGRSDEFPATMALLGDMRGSADYLRPFELIQRLLLRHAGRARLIGRLGDEHRDAIDALLRQALDYERLDVPSLTGFLAWLDGEDIEVKRQAEGQGRRLRVMSIHGAKGLEAPVVILPDTMKDNRSPTDPLVVAGCGTVMWCVPAAEQPAAMRAAVTARSERDKAERRRQLYVAMTRARNWLIVCGAGDPERCEGRWYGDIGDGIAEMEPHAIPTPAGPGLRVESGDWSTVAPARARPGASPVAFLPDWVDREAPPQPPTPPLLTPSNLGGAKALAGDMAETDEDALLARGRLIHNLLEALPLAPHADWPGIAARLLPDGADPSVLDEARGVLIAPALSDLLARPAILEVDVTAPHPSGRHVFGTIDRLIVAADHVLAIDYKSNRIVPDRHGDVPDGLLRQMGAYAHALKAIYPGRRVETALLWTRTATLMPLPGPLVRAAFARALVP